MAELLDRIEERPKDRHEQFEYVADVKTRAQALGAKMDGYLEREEYYYPADVGISVDIESEDVVRLRPEFPNPPASLDVTQLSSSNPYLVSRRPDGRRLRAILSKPVRDKLKLIEDNQLIEGEKVPEFLQNPPCRSTRWAGHRLVPIQ